MGAPTANQELTLINLTSYSKHFKKSIRLNLEVTLNLPFLSEASETDATISNILLGPRCLGIDQSVLNTFVILLPVL